MRLHGGREFSNFAFMIRPARSRCVCLLLLGTMLSGCGSGGSSRIDEEKEAHFLMGKSRVTAMDFAGAINAFEKSLAMNPRSAAAHFELAMIYGEKVNRPARAIYHYEKYLEFRPNAGNADIVQQHILALKQELAKGVLPLPLTPDIQQRFDQLAEENRQLKEELERLRADRPSAGAGQVSLGTGSSRPQVVPGPASATLRTHKVVAGETPFSIARDYRVNLNAFLAANPGLDPRRMQVGQTVNVPGR